MSRAECISAFTQALAEVPWRPSGTPVLYVGCHEARHLDVALAALSGQSLRAWTGGDILTLDKDPELLPTIVHDLDTAAPVPGGPYDLVIVASVLMHLEHPLRALGRLLDATTGLLLLQEPVARPRPDRDPWPDRNRFWGRDLPLPQDALHFAAQGRRVVEVDLPELLRVRYYTNPAPAVSATWVFNGRATALRQPNVDCHGGAA